jgi:RNA polymerase subunit RPABC4/transcription elongation factor Spt4
MGFNPAAMSSFVLVLTGFGAAFIAALWLSLLVWTFRDIRARTRDPLVRILSVLVAAVLFLPGVLIYLILRPAHTLEEAYQGTLEEEALLQSIEDNPQCPGCSRRIKDDWIVCPSCHTKLKKPCSSCGRLMELPWNLCPYCGTPAPGVPHEEPLSEETAQAEESLLEEEPATPESRIEAALNALAEDSED